MIRSYSDMHCDTLMKAFFDHHDTIWDQPDYMFDYKSYMETAGLLQFLAVWFPASEYVHENGQHMVDDMAYFEGCHQILENTLADHKEVMKVRNYAEYEEMKKSCKMGALLSMEDGRAVGGSFEQLEYFYKQDVRLITLTWNFENCFGFPNSTDPQIMEKGLKPFGKEAIQAMQEKGMLVDVSHLNDGGFYDVADICKRPFVASHSNCRELMGHQRNLKDDMIRILAEKGGVMGLNFCPKFVGYENGTKEPICTAEGLAAHAFRAADIGGVEVVAIGTDFDGIGGNVKVNCPGKMEMLWDALKKVGFTESQIDKIAFGNVERVLKDSLN